MIIGGMLVKNEADRWLIEACEQLVTICGRVIILDDCSTDNTIEICKKYNFDILKSNKSFWEIDELKQRKILFNAIWHTAKVDDILLILDADEILINPDRTREILETANKRLTVIGFTLYDMWDKTHYRNDQYWNAHKSLWPMAIRKIQGVTNFQWHEQGLHCGRFPYNLTSNPHSYVTHIELGIKHMGWSTQEDRQKKYDRYMRIDPEGKYGILEQYLSILDDSPNLEVLK